jgi:outer membrane cobalamin receptor
LSLKSKISMKNQIVVVRPGRRFLALVISAACAAPGLAPAQSAPVAQVIDNIAVTANRMPQPESETLAQSVTITRREIEEAASGTLTELLQRKAGVEIRITGFALQ